MIGLQAEVKRFAPPGSLNRGSVRLIGDDQLQWLRADLVAWEKRFDKDGDRAWFALSRKMTRWKHDTHLVGVRDPKALEKLPPDERGAWQKLWQDVEAVLAKTGERGG